MKRIFLLISLAVFTSSSFLNAEMCENSKIFELINNKKVSFQKRMVAFELVRKLHLKRSSESNNILNQFVYEVLTGDFKDDDKLKVFNTAGSIPLTAPKKCLVKLKKALKNPQLSQKSVKWIFGLIYSNFGYTLDFKKELFNYLYKNRKKLSKHPYYILGMVDFLFNNESYKVSDSYRNSLQNDQKLDWLNIGSKLDELTTTVIRNECGVYELLKYSKIMTSDDKVISVFLQNNEEMFSSIWSTCPSDLFYTNQTISKALPVSDAICSFLENNPEKKDMVKNILEIEASSFFLTAILKKNFNLFYKIKSQLKEPSEDLDLIINFFLKSNNDANEVKQDYTLIEQDNNLIEINMFNKLLKLDAEVEGRSDYIYNKLRIWALTYSDFKLPESYKLVLDDILNGDVSRSKILAMSIILIQRNPKYNHTVKEFIEKILDKPENFKFILPDALGNGIDIHWINDPDIRTMCIKFLDKRSSFEIDLDLIALFWNVSNDKILIAEKLLKFYTLIRNQTDIKNDLSKIKALNSALNETLEKIFLGKKYYSVNDWKRYILKVKLSNN